MQSKLLVSIVVGFLSIFFLSFVTCAQDQAQESVIGSQVMPDVKTQEMLIDEQVRKLKTGDITDFMQTLDSDTRRVIPEFNLRKFVTAEGIRAFDPRVMLREGFLYLGRELVGNSRLMGEIMVVAIISALIGSVSTAFAGDGASELAHMVCYLVLVAISIKSFIGAVGVAGAAISSMSSFMTALVPTLFTLLVAMGGVASAALMQPLVVMVTSGIGSIINGLVFPLLYLFAILGIISNLSGRAQVTKLAALAKDASVATLGFCMTFLTGTVVVKGLAGPGLDGVSMRASKFLAKAYIPVIGGLFADAWDSISGCSLLVKNSLGIFGLISMAAICLFPILKIGALVLVYRIAGALCQPVSDSRLVSMLNDMASSLLILLTAVAAVGFMFFISLTVIVGLGSMTMFAR